MTLLEFGHNLEKFSEQDEILDEVRDILDTIDRRAPGRLYRKSIISKLEKAGWSGRITIDQSSRSGIDGIRRDIGIVVQLGNHGSGVLPIFNLEYLYARGKIKSGIFVTQTFDQAVQRESLRNLGATTDGNRINAERLRTDLELYSIFLKCPLLVIAMCPS